MYLDKLKADLSPEGFIVALRILANWSNGNIMATSRQRMANIAKGESADGPPGNPDAGHEEQMSPTKRGSLFASIRTECMNTAEGMGLKGFDLPRGFKEYLESRITGLRSQEPTNEEIKQEMLNTLGTTFEEAKSFLIQSYKVQAATLETDKEDLIASDSDYDSSIEFEEAEFSLPMHQQHRMRVKLIDGLLYECERLQKFRQQYPNFTDLQTKRELLMRDAITIEADLGAFEKQHRNEIDKELLGTERVLIHPTRMHTNTLYLAKKQLLERAAAEAEKVKKQA